MDILLILTVGTLNVACFFIGAKVGQKVSKGEDIKLPAVHPMEAIRDRNAKREAEHEQDRIATIMRNIDSYDGTPNGQRDVPR